MKNRIITAIIFCLFMCFSNVHAETKKQITTTASIEDQQLFIRGTIADTTEQVFVALILYTPDEIIHFDQAITTRDGDFVFFFPIDGLLSPSSFGMTISVDTDVEFYKATLSYPDLTITEGEQKVVDADMTISFDGNVPKLTGTLSCTTGKTISFLVRNKDTNDIIWEEIIESISGEYSLSQTLPKIDAPYKLSLMCSENGVAVVDVRLDIEYNSLLVNTSGLISVTDGYYVDGKITAPIQHSLLIEDEKNIDSVLPRGFFPLSLSIKGYQTEVFAMPEISSSGGYTPDPTPTPLPDPNGLHSIYPINLEKGEKITLMVKGQGLKLFEEKTYQITFDPNLLAIVQTNRFYPTGSEYLKYPNSIELSGNLFGSPKFTLGNINITTGYRLDAGIGLITFINNTDSAISTQVTVTEVE